MALDGEINRITTVIFLLAGREKAGARRSISSHLAVFVQALFAANALFARDIRDSLRPSLFFRSALKRDGRDSKHEH